MAQRDFQRNALYRAEDAAFSGMALAYPTTIGEIQSLLEKARNMHGMARLFRQPVNVVVNNRLRTTYALAHSGGVKDGTIEFHKDHIKPTTFCHELAHILTWRARGYDNIAAHGPEFATFYVALVKELLGNGYGNILIRCFRAADIKMS